MRAGRLAGICAAVLLIPALAGCGKKGGDVAESGAESAGSAAEPGGEETRDPYFNVQGKKVGIAFPEEDGRWKRDGEWLVSAFQAEGVTGELASAGGDGAQMAEQIDALISGGADLLIVASVDDDLAAEPLARAKDAGIPVISYDHLIRGSDAVSYYVSFDHYGVGCLEGGYVIDSLGLAAEGSKKEYNIEFAAGDRGDVRDSYIFNGAYDTLKPYLDAGVLKIPSGQSSFSEVQTEGSSTDAAYERMKSILGSFYTGSTELHAVVCANDPVALGAARAVDADYSGKNHVIITGEGGDEENLAAIRAGRQTMTVCENEEDEASVALDLSLTLLNGDVADANLIAESGWDFDCTYDTSSYDNGRGIVPSYLLAPYVVTAEELG